MYGFFYVVHPADEYIRKSHLHNFTAKFVHMHANVSVKSHWGAGEKGACFNLAEYYVPSAKDQTDF